MTDNEKRAHDLAIAAVRILAENKSINDGAGISVDENGERVFNVFAIYKDAYTSALSFVSHEFPT